MLTHLFISNFLLVTEQELTFSGGLTALTGETGAGKSLLLDALGLTLGGRAEGQKVRAGQPQAEVSATFDLSGHKKAATWLAQADLANSGSPEECMIRRVVMAEGRSRGYVNGRPVTQTQLKALGEMLLNVHSQHEHQSLLMSAHHQRLLDDYGGHQLLLEQVRSAFGHWQTLQAQLQHAQTHSDEMNARFQLLSYQVEELDQLNLQVGELEELEAAQQRLANAEQVQTTCTQLAGACINDDSALTSQLHRMLHQLDQLPFASARIQSVKGLLQEAKIQVEEAGQELGAEAASELSAEELPAIEQRLSWVYEVARKHKVNPADLVQLHQQVAQELSSLKSGDQEIEALEKGVALALGEYVSIAKTLTESRQAAAVKLAKAVNQQLKKLAMGQAAFSVYVTPNEAPSRNGQETLEFQIATVPGQAPQGLNKVASGGELSRVSLAIQVVIAKTSVTPTLIFDEVDVGIGGATGDVVGQMLRALGKSAQVLCVTHLAQVASKANQHFTVEKVVNKKGASTVIQPLDEEGRVLEVARMMGGAIESEQSLAHARQMLALSEA